MRVLLVYHGAALASSRAIFEALGGRDGIQLRALGPRRGWNRMRGQWLELPPRVELPAYTLVSGRVIGSRRDYSRPYLTGLLREMRRFRPQIIHVLNEATSHVVFQAVLYRNWILPRCKVLAFGFENIFPERLAHGSAWKRLRWRILNEGLDGVTYANSEGIRRLRQLGLSKPRMRLTYWGVPLDRYQRRDPEELRGRLGLQGKIVLGYAGRIEKEKGLEEVLAALTLLPQDVVFVVVGSGRFDEELQRLADGLGVGPRYVRVPRVADGEMAAYLSFFDALVLPSRTTEGWKEQFGRVIPEAMACGVPVVGSSSGAIPEVIGDGGYVFEEGNPSGLASAVRSLLLLDEDERSQLQERARKRAIELMGVNVFAGNLHSFYEELVQ